MNVVKLSLWVVLLGCFLTGCDSGSSSIPEEKQQQTDVAVRGAQNATGFQTTEKTTKTFAEVFEVDAGARQFADANLMVPLVGSISNRSTTPVVTARWEQISGPPATILNPGQLSTLVVLPDVSTTEQLSFRLYGVNGAGMANADTTNIVVQPLDRDLRVVSVAGAENAAELNFDVRLNKPVTSVLSASYFTQNKTATAGEDYTEVQGTVEFAPGESLKTIVVPLLDDGGEEGNEYFELVVEAQIPGEAEVTRLVAQGIAVIQDDEGVSTYPTTPPLYEGPSNITQFQLEGTAGEVRVNLAWSQTDYEVRLFVIDPCGNRLSTQMPQADCDALTGAAEALEGETYADNAYWVNAPFGSYVVGVEHIAGMPVDYNVRLFYGDESHRFSGTIGAGDTVEVARFEYLGNSEGGPNEGGEGGTSASSASSSSSSSSSSSGLTSSSSSSSSSSGDAASSSSSSASSSASTSASSSASTSTSSSSGTSASSSGSASSSASSSTSASSSSTSASSSSSSNSSSSSSTSTSASSSSSSTSTGSTTSTSTSSSSSSTSASSSSGVVGKPNLSVMLYAPNVNEVLGTPIALTAIGQFDAAAVNPRLILNIVGNETETELEAAGTTIEGVVISSTFVVDQQALSLPNGTYDFTAEIRDGLGHAQTSEPVSLSFRAPELPEILLTEPDQDFYTQPVGVSGTVSWDAATQLTQLFARLVPEGDWGGEPPADRDIPLEEQAGTFATVIEDLLPGGYALTVHAEDALQQVMVTDPVRFAFDLPDALWVSVISPDAQSLPVQLLQPSWLVTAAIDYDMDYPIIAATLRLVDNGEEVATVEGNAQTEATGVWQWAVDFEALGLSPGDYQAQIQVTDSLERAATSDWMDVAYAMPDLPTLTLTSPVASTYYGDVPVTGSFSVDPEFGEVNLVAELLAREPLEPLQTLPLVIEGNAFASTVPAANLQPGAYILRVSLDDGLRASPLEVEQLWQFATPEELAISWVSPSTEAASTIWQSAFPVVANVAFDPMFNLETLELAFWLGDEVVQRVDLLPDLQSEVGRVEATVNWAALELPSGVYQLQITGSDSRGRTAASDKVTVTFVEPQMPRLNVISPTEGEYKHDIEVAGSYFVDPVIFGAELQAVLIGTSSEGSNSTTIELVKSTDSFAAKVPFGTLSPGEYMLQVSLDDGVYDPLISVTPFSVVEPIALSVQWQSPTIETPYSSFVAQLPLEVTVSGDPIFAITALDLLVTQTGEPVFETSLLAQLVEGQVVENVDLSASDLSVGQYEVVLRVQDEAQRIGVSEALVFDYLAPEPIVVNLIAPESDSVLVFRPEVSFTGQLEWDTRLPLAALDAVLLDSAGNEIARLPVDNLDADSGNFSGAMAFGALEPELGDYTLVIEAQDALRTVTSRAVTVQLREAQTPDIWIEAPADDSLLFENTVTVSGGFTVDERLQGQTLKGYLYAVGEGENLIGDATPEVVGTGLAAEVYLPLAGAYRVEWVIEDALGNQQSTSVVFAYRPAVSPVVTLEAPEFTLVEGDVFEYQTVYPNFDFSGRVALDDALPLLELVAQLVDANGNTVASADLLGSEGWNAQTGEFNGFWDLVELDLSTGKYALQIAARNDQASGQLSGQYLLSYRVPESPSITLTSPNLSRHFSLPDIVADYSVDPDLDFTAGASVVQILADGSQSTFTLDLVLTEGDELFGVFPESLGEAVYEVTAYLDDGIHPLVSDQFRFEVRAPEPLSVKLELPATEQDYLDLLSPQLRIVGVVNQDSSLTLSSLQALLYPLEGSSPIRGWNLLTANAFAENVFQTTLDFDAQDLGDGLYVLIIEAKEVIEGRENVAQSTPLTINFRRPDQPVVLLDALETQPYVTDITLSGTYQVDTSVAVQSFSAVITHTAANTLPLTVPIEYQDGLFSAVIPRSALQPGTYNVEANLVDTVNLAGSDGATFMFEWPSKLSVNIDADIPRTQTIYEKSLDLYGNFTHDSRVPVTSLQAVIYDDGNLIQTLDLFRPGYEGNSGFYSATVDLSLVGLNQFDVGVRVTNTLGQSVEGPETVSVTYIEDVPLKIELSTSFQSSQGANMPVAGTLTGVTGNANLSVKLDDTLVFESVPLNADHEFMFTVPLALFEGRVRANYTLQIEATDDTDSDIFKGIVQYVPTITLLPGGDVVAYGDITSLQDQKNPSPILQNFFDYTSALVDAKEVWFDASHVTLDANDENIINMRKAIDTTLADIGLDLVDVTDVRLPIDIPASVKVFVSYLPGVVYSQTEVETLRRFAARGGRIVVLTEMARFYDGIDRAFNPLMASLGVPIRQLPVNANETSQSASHSGVKHQMTEGVDSVFYSNGGAFIVGKGGKPLLLDDQARPVLAVAKVNTNSQSSFAVEIISPKSSGVYVESEIPSLYGAVSPQGAAVLEVVGHINGSSPVDFTECFIGDLVCDIPASELQSQNDIWVEAIDGRGYSAFSQTRFTLEANAINLIAGFGVNGRPIFNDAVHIYTNRSRSAIGGTFDIQLDGETVREFSNISPSQSFAIPLSSIEPLLGANQSSKLVTIDVIANRLGVQDTVSLLMFLHRGEGAALNAPNEGREVLHYSVTGTGISASNTVGNNYFYSQKGGNQTFYGAELLKPAANAYVFAEGSGVDHIFLPDNAWDSATSNILSFDVGLEFSDFRFAAVQDSPNSKSLNLLISHTLRDPTTWQIVKGYFDQAGQPIDSIKIAGVDTISVPSEVNRAYWSPWINIDRPTDGEDNELLGNTDNFNVCASPLAIKARVADTRTEYYPGDDLPNVMKRFDALYGLSCVNSNSQECLDYEVSFLCYSGLSQA